MKQSKFDKKRIGHLRPIEDCRIPELTHGEICIECNRCGRFKPIAKKKKRVEKK